MVDILEIIELIQAIEQKLEFLKTLDPLSNEYKFNHDAKNKLFLELEKRIKDEPKFNISGANLGEQISENKEKIEKLKESYQKASRQIELAAQSNKKPTVSTSPTNTTVQDFYTTVGDIPEKTVHGAKSVGDCHADLVKELTEQRKIVSAWKTEVDRLSAQNQITHKNHQEIINLHKKLEALEASITAASKDVATRQNALSQVNQQLAKEKAKPITTKIGTWLKEKIVGPKPTPPKLGPEPAPNGDFRSDKTYTLTGMLEANRSTERLKNEALTEILAGKSPIIQDKPSIQERILSFFATQEVKELTAKKRALEKRVKVFNRSYESLKDKRTTYKENHRETQLLTKAKNFVAPYEIEKLAEKIWDAKTSSPDKEEIAVAKELSRKDAIQRLEQKQKAVSASCGKFIEEIDRQVSRLSARVEKHQGFDGLNADDLSEIGQTRQQLESLRTLVNDAKNGVIDAQSTDKVKDAVAKLPPNIEANIERYDAKIGKKIALYQSKVQIAIDDLEEETKGLKEKVESLKGKDKVYIENKVNEINQTIKTIKENSVKPILSNHIFSDIATKSGSFDTDKKIRIDVKQDIVTDYIRDCEVDDQGNIKPRVMQIDSVLNPAPEGKGTQQRLNALLQNLHTIEKECDQILHHHEIDPKKSANSVIPQKTIAAPIQGNKMSQAFAALAYQLKADLKSKIDKAINAGNVDEFCANSQKLSDERHVVGQLTYIAKKLNLPPDTTVDKFFDVLKNYADKENHQELKEILDSAEKLNLKQRVAPYLSGVQKQAHLPYLGKIWGAIEFVKRVTKMGQKDKSTFNDQTLPTLEKELKEIDPNIKHHHARRTNKTLPNELPVQTPANPKNNDQKTIRINCAIPLDDAFTSIIPKKWMEALKNMPAFFYDDEQDSLLIKGVKKVFNVISEPPTKTVYTVKPETKVSNVVKTQTQAASTKIVESSKSESGTQLGAKQEKVAEQTQKSVNAQNSTVASEKEPSMVKVPEKSADSSQRSGQTRSASSSSPSSALTKVNTSTAMTKASPSTCVIIKNGAKNGAYCVTARGQTDSLVMNVVPRALNLLTQDAKLVAKVTTGLTITMPFVDHYLMQTTCGAGIVMTTSNIARIYGPRILTGARIASVPALVAYGMYKTITYDPVGETGQSDYPFTINPIDNPNTFDTSPTHCFFLTAENERNFVQSWLIYEKCLKAYYDLLRYKRNLDRYFSSDPEILLEEPVHPSVINYRRVPWDGFDEEELRIKGDLVAQATDHLKRNFNDVLSEYPRQKDESLIESFNSFLKLKIHENLQDNNDSFSGFLRFHLGYGDYKIPKYVYSPPRTNDKSLIIYGEESGCTYYLHNVGGKLTCSVKTKPSPEEEALKVLEKDLVVQLQLLKDREEVYKSSAQILNERKCDVGFEQPRFYWAKAEQDFNQAEQAYTDQAKKIMSHLLCELKPNPDKKISLHAANIVVKIQGYDLDYFLSWKNKEGLKIWDCTTKAKYRFDYGPIHDYRLQINAIYDPTTATANRKAIEIIEKTLVHKAPKTILSTSLTMVSPAFKTLEQVIKADTIICSLFLAAQ